MVMHKNCALTGWWVASRLAENFARATKRGYAAIPETLKPSLATVLRRTGWPHLSGVVHRMAGKYFVGRRSQSYQFERVITIQE